MKISIKNVGVVAEAQVDLTKKLTVLCGPNNVGKTYVAYALYGLLKSVSDLRISRRPSEALRAVLAPDDKWEINILDFLKKNEFAILKEYVADFKTSLFDIFATDINKFSGAELSVQMDLDADPVYLEKTISNTSVDVSYQLLPGYTYNFKKPIDSLVLEFTRIIRRTGQVDSVTPEQQIRAKNQVLDLIVPGLILSTVFSKSFILPTLRTAVNVFNTGLSIKRTQLLDYLGKIQELITPTGELPEPKRVETDAMVREAQRSIFNEVKRYTMPVRDSLLVADDIVRKSKLPGAFGFLADELERTILKGTISISEAGEILYSPNNYNDAGLLSVNLWGSMVSSLSSLVFYLRHLAVKGDLIIFDEPELNLHPDNQILIARFLATLINSGFSVIISTHSDYIIRELNNLIMINQVPEERFKELKTLYEYADTHKIKGDDVQVLLFARKDSDAPNKNIIARIVPIDNNGFEVETIDNTTERLNKATTDIFISKRTIQ